MRAHFWAGFATGALAAVGSTLALFAAFAAALRDLEVAEARTWTDEDDELRMLAMDANGQLP